MWQWYTITIQGVRIHVRDRSLLGATVRIARIVEDWLA